MLKNCILVIDDDELICTVIKKILEKRGFEVVEAHDGDEGVDLFKQNLPFMVITDILMPKKEGIETIREIREVQPETKIVAISGGGASKNMSFLRMASHAGADKVLAKPFMPAQLNQILDELVDETGT
ncbi:MAG: response regulator [Alphaproteobacteria bacterium]|nr:response regulator [Alphaproteobacteria bacterium]